MAESGDAGRIGLELGEDRQRIAAGVMAELKEEKFIRGFVSTGSRSHADVKKGVDFFIVKIIGGKYRIIPISITGERYAAKHAERHPEVPIITIGFKEDGLSIRKKIEEAVLHYAHG